MRYRSSPFIHCVLYPFLMVKRWLGATLLYHSETTSLCNLPALFISTGYIRWISPCQFVSVTNSSENVIQPRALQSRKNTADLNRERNHSREILLRSRDLLPSTMGAPRFDNFRLDFISSRTLPDLTSFNHVSLPVVVVACSIEVQINSVAAVEFWFLGLLLFRLRTACFSARTTTIWEARNVFHTKMKNPNNIYGAYCLREPGNHISTRSIGISNKEIGYLAETMRYASTWREIMSDVWHILEFF